MPVWTPRVTVAAIIRHQERFLLVKERADGKIVYNQPAGHLEENETLIDAVKREVLEETGLAFTPTALVGIYRWPHPARNRTYLRFCFTGNTDSVQTSPRDADIIEAVWMTEPELRALGADRLRSPQVLAGIHDFQDGMRYNLDMLNELA